MAEREGETPLEHPRNSRAFLEKASAGDIDLGIENGTITNPDAVEILIQKKRDDLKREHEKELAEQPERLYNIAADHAASEAFYESVLTGKSKDLARYCAQQAQQHTNYCIQRAEKSIEFVYQEPDSVYTQGAPYAFLAAAEHYQIASYWYAMGARLARKQGEQKTAENTSAS